MSKVSVLIPAYNEELSSGALFEAKRNDGFLCRI